MIMSEAKVYYCMGCGAPLNVSINRAFVFCQFCGCKNEISSQEMRAKIDVGTITVDAKTDIEGVLKSAEYAISIEQYDKANELLLATIMSGERNYRIYILKSKIDLLLDDNKSLFENLRTLKEMEKAQTAEKEVTKAVCELMQFRGKNGVTALHNATFHELLDMVEYCVEHNSDLNCVAGMKRVTPISIMFVKISPKLSKIDGTPFIRNKKKVKEIRSYLMSKGAKDSFRFGY